MAIRKIKGGWRVDISYFDEKKKEKIRKRIKSPDNSKNGARTLEIQLLEMIRVGKNPFDKENRDETKNELIFKIFSEEFFQTYVLVKNKHSEIIGKRCMLDRHLVPFFGNFTLENINPKSIDR